jgi:NADH-quinone oxidoreductase subunit C
MTFDLLNKIIANSSAHNIDIKQLGSDVNSYIQVLNQDLTTVCEILYNHADLFFDSLSCLTALDNGKEAGTLEVIYNLYSIPFNHSLMLKVMLPRESPEIDSVASIWRTANWHEREAYDMFGIHFKNHPDLRRILMPADWEGHPLRKDYQPQETYRDIKVAYHNN